MSDAQSFRTEVLVLRVEGTVITSGNLYRANRVIDSTVLRAVLDNKTTGVDIMALFIELNPLTRARKVVICAEYGEWSGAKVALHQVWKATRGIRLSGSMITLCEDNGSTRVI